MNEYETKNGDCINIAADSAGDVWLSIIRNNRTVVHQKLDAPKDSIWMRGFIRGVTSCSAFIIGIYLGSRLVEWITS